jgi:ERCC4-related helicase
MEQELNNILQLMYSDTNLVISSPTGSGKTCLMELAIIRLLMKPNTANAKIIYLAPTKVPNLIHIMYVLSLIRFTGPMLRTNKGLEAKISKA